MPWQALTREDLCLLPEDQTSRRHDGARISNEMPPGVVHESRDFWYSEEASALVDVVGGGLRRRRRAATVRHTLQLPLGIILNPAARVQNTHPVIQRSRPYVAIQ